MDFRGILSLILNLRMKFSSICIYKPVILGLQMIAKIET